MWSLKLKSLEKFHDVCVESTRVDLEALKSSSLGQGVELLLGPFFASRVVSQHYDIDVNHSLGGKAAVWCNRKNAFRHNHLPMLRQRIVAIFQQFQAVLVAPIVTDPLQTPHYIRPNTYMQYRVGIGMGVGVLNSVTLPS